MLTNQKRDYFFLMSTFTKPVMGFSLLAFGRLGPVVASRSRLVVGSQPLAMSLSCASTTSLTLAASAYVIFGIFGLTAKQPLLSTLAIQWRYTELHQADIQLGCVRIEADMSCVWQLLAWRKRHFNAEQ
jgi:hypothetical protein